MRPWRLQISLSGRDSLFRNVVCHRPCDSSSRSMAWGTPEGRLWIGISAQAWSQSRKAFSWRLFVWTFCSSSSALVEWSPRARPQFNQYLQEFSRLAACERYRWTPPLSLIKEKRTTNLLDTLPKIIITLSLILIRCSVCQRHLPQCMQGEEGTGRLERSWKWDSHHRQHHPEGA